MGVSGWNGRIEARLGARAGTGWYAGRPIMVTRNCVIRKNMRTYAIERYAPRYDPPWVDAIDWRESIVMEPDIQEITEAEAKTLMPKFQPLD